MFFITQTVVILCLFFLKLTVIQIRIESLTCQQFFMITLLNDISVLHHQDQICILDSRKSVGDNKAGSALHQVIHGLLDLHLGSGIYGRCGLIQDQNLIVRQDRPCNGEQLLLALGSPLHRLHPVFRNGYFP